MRRGFLTTKKTTTVTGTHPTKDHDSKPLESINLDSENADKYEQRFVMTRQPSGLPGETTECLITGWAWRQITETPGFPKVIAIPENGPVHRIAEVPGMGKGMFATRKLFVGDLVLDERPLLVAPTYIPVSLHQQEMHLRRLFSRMPAEDQQAYMELQNRYEGGNTGPICGILYSNGLVIGKGLRNKGSREDDIAAQYSAVCKDLSRVNHSCCPNVTRTWDTSSLSMQIRAVRDIVPDEEITVNYVEIINPYEERKTALRPFSIECKCPACLNHEVSDARRKIFREHARIKAPVVRDPDDALDTWIQPALKRLEEMEEEGVQASVHYGRTLYQIVKGYAVIGDQRAVDYGRKLYSYQCAYRQEDSEDGLFKALTELATMKQALRHMWGAALQVADEGIPLAVVRA